MLLAAEKIVVSDFLKENRHFPLKQVEPIKEN